MLKTALRVLAATSLAAASLTVAAPADATVQRATTARSQGPDTGPCGPVGQFRSSDWWRTTTSPSISPAIRHAAADENWQWRDDINTLWRGDTRDKVQQLFDDGFTRCAGPSPGGTPEHPGRVAGAKPAAPLSPGHHASGLRAKRQAWRLFTRPSGSCSMRAVTLNPAPRSSSAVRSSGRK